MKRREPRRPKKARPMGTPEAAAAVELSWRWRTAGGRKPWRRRRWEALLSKQHIRHHSKLLTQIAFSLQSLSSPLSHFVSVPKRQQELEKWKHAWSGRAGPPYARQAICLL